MTIGRIVTTSIKRRNRGIFIWTYTIVGTINTRTIASVTAARRIERKNAAPSPG